MKVRDHLPSQASVARVRFRHRLIALSVSACFASGIAHALPTGPQVVAGSVTFNQAGNTLTVGNTPGSIINWNAFSIGAQETVRFQQQNSLSAVLNRVSGGDVSKILGELTSNGRVWLINPNGILFGAGSRVDVQGLIASTLNISDQDFLAGKLNFQAGTSVGSLKNAGTIQAAQNIYLIAPDIENSGIVRSDKGEVLLAAGRQVSLVDAAHPDIQVVVSAAEDKAVNLGTLMAGKVSAFGALLQQKGVVNADRVDVDDHGRIVFRASKQLEVAAGSRTTANGPTGGSITLQTTGGDTYVSGQVEATGKVGAGGTAHILGQRVAVMDRAVVDASGATDGGTILVGGDYQGKNPAIQNSQITYFGPTATLKANGGTVGAGGTAPAAGQGGKIVVWADDTTRAYGAIEAKGGAGGGDGGFVETSGHYLDTRGIKVDTRANHGQTGQWLLDPASITIVGGTGDGDSDGDTTFIGLGGGTPTAGSIFMSETGPSVVYASEIVGQSATADIILEATDSITTSGSFVGDQVLLATHSNLTLRTRNQATPDLATGINLTTSSSGTALEFKTQGTGTITIETGVGGTGPYHTAPITTGKLTTAGGNITINSSGGITLKGNVNSGAGEVALSAYGGITNNDGGGTPIIYGLVTANKLAATVGSGGGGISLIGNNPISHLEASAAAGNIVVETAAPTGLTIDSGGITATNGGVTILHYDATTDSGITVDGDLFSDSGTTIGVASGDGGIALGSITLGGATTFYTSAGDITQTGPLTMVGHDFPLTLNAGSGSILLDNALNQIEATNISASNTGGASITLKDASTNTVLGAISSEGNVTVIAGGALDVEGPISTIGAHQINLTGGSITFVAAGTLDAGSGTINIAATGVNALTSIPAGTTMSAADINIKTDNLGIAGSNGDISATSSINITRYTNGVEVQVGGSGSDSTGILNVSQSEFNVLSAPIYRFGDTASTGGLRVYGQIDVLAGQTLSLLTSNVGGSQIVQNAGAVINAEYLRAEGGSGVTLDSEANSVVYLSGKTSSGNFRFKNGHNLELKSIDGQSGIHAGGNEVWLDVDGVLTQTAAPITADGLKLSGSMFEAVTLNGANMISKLAASMPTGSLSFTNGQALAIDTVGTVNGIQFDNNTYPISITTTSGNLTVNQPILSDALGGAQITLASANALVLNANISSTYNVTLSGPVILSAGAGGIDQTAGAITADGLKVVSGGTVTLDQNNAINTLAGNITGGSGFSFTNGNDLEVNSVSGTTGLTVAAGDIQLQTAGLDKVLTITQDVQATTGNVTYITDNLAHNATTTTSGSAGKYAEVKPYTATTAIEFDVAVDAPGTLRLSSGELTFSTPLLKVGNIAVSGNILVNEDIAPASFPSLSLITSGTITQTTGNTITIANLNAHGMSGVTLTEANAVSGKLAGQTGSGNFAFTNTGALNVDQVDTVNNGITSTSGNITLTSSSGSVTQSGTAVIGTGGTLAVNAATGISLPNSNTAATVALNNSTSGNINYVASAASLAVSSATNVGAGGITLLNSGDLSVGTVSTGTGSVSITSTGGQILDGNGASSNVAGGVITLSASTGIPVVSGTYTLGVTPGTSISAQTTSGDIYLASTADMPVATMSAPAGVVSLNAINNGSILDANGTSGNITADSASLTAWYDIGTVADPLETQVSSLGIVKGQGSGVIAIANTGTLNTLIDGYYATSVTLTNSGAITTTGLVNSGGSVTLTAQQGALTIGSAGISAHDSVTLTAGGPTWVAGRTGDDLTINGSLALTYAYGGTISLNAGNTISGSYVPVSAGYITVVSNPNLNLPAYTPTTYTVDTILSSGKSSHTYGQASDAIFGYSPLTAVPGDAISGVATFTPTINSTTPAGSFMVYYASGLTSTLGSTFVPGAGQAYTINPAVLVITASLTGTVEKVYDGNKLATLAPGNFLLTGFATGEGATVTQTVGEYAAKNAGGNIEITVNLAATDFTPTGTTSFANYILPVGTLKGNIGKITPKPLTLAGLEANKVYDGNPIATLKGTLTDAISTDEVSFSTSSALFADKNVGKDKPVTLTNFALAGADKDNYVIASDTQLVAEITQRPSVTWLGTVSNAWSNPNNWEDGAIPDLSNVDSVSIPSGTVSFDIDSASLSSLSSGGTLQLGSGSLTVGSTSTAGYVQTGGLLSGGTLAVTNSFSKSGGTLALSGPLSINHTSGDLIFSNDLPLTLGSVNATTGSVDITSHGGLFVNGATTAVNQVTYRTFSPMVINGSISAPNGINLTTSTGTGNDDLTINGALVTNGGNVSLNSGGSVQQNANISTGGGSVSASAATGDIVMASGTTTTTSGGSIGYAAPAGNIQLAMLDAGSTGSIGLNAGGSLSGVGSPNLVGASAQLSAGGDASLATQVAAIGGTVGGNLQINNNGTVITHVPDKPLPTDPDTSLDQQLNCLIDPTACGTGATGTGTETVLASIEQTQQTITNTTSVSTTTNTSDSNSTANTSSDSPPDSTTTNSSSSSSSTSEEEENQRKSQNQNTGTTPTTSQETAANAKPNYCN